MKNDTRKLNLEVSSHFRYLVLDHAGSADTEWWNSNTSLASYIDFSKPAAAKWFADHLTDLKTSSGVDGYKFDAGESSWTPPVSFALFIIYINCLGVSKITH